MIKLTLMIASIFFLFLHGYAYALTQCVDSSTGKEIFTSGICPQGYIVARTQYGNTDDAKDNSEGSRKNEKKKLPNGTNSEDDRLAKVASECSKRCATEKCHFSDGTMDRHCMVMCDTEMEILYYTSAGGGALSLRECKYK